MIHLLFSEVGINHWQAGILSSARQRGIGVLP